MNNPIPQLMATFISTGIAASKRCRAPEIDRNRKSKPLQNTTPRAEGHGTCMAPQMVKAKNAFMPMPGASAIG
jgi:hypothetical protein